MTEFVTKSGKVLTEADCERLADEAEQGWTQPTDAQRAKGLQFALKIFLERFNRLSQSAGAALERIEAGDVEAAVSILRDVVTIDGQYIIKEND